MIILTQIGVLTEFDLLGHSDTPQDISIDLRSENSDLECFNQQLQNNCGSITTIVVEVLNRHPKNLECPTTWDRVKSSCFLIDSKMGHTNQDPHNWTGCRVQWHSIEWIIVSIAAVGPIENEKRFIIELEKLVYRKRKMCV